MGTSARNILIVGGSSGIGLELAKRMSQQGNRVTVWSRSFPDELKEAGIAHSTVDVTQPLAEQNPEVPSPLHGLVYCPGSVNLRPFNRLRENHFKADYEINVLGAVRVLQEALPSFGSEGGSVVFFSTVAVSTGMAYHASIASAKAALEGLTKSLAAEYAAKNIRFNAVAPSLTDTPLAEKLLATDEKREKSAQRHPLRRVGTPTDMAASAAFLLSPDSSWITGQILPVDGGMSSVRMLDA
ncbi:SDR family NAD(P)-dependent oxidoreductase [Balneolales bacterium ANBcel1]|nr:SDR family NAD(P)-dependent oxidoreductase [Balneolales bacterium ANBcel1]